MINNENISTGNVPDNYNVNWTQNLLDNLNKIPNEKDLKDYFIKLVSKSNDYFPNVHRDNINFLIEIEKYKSNDKY